MSDLNIEDLGFTPISKAPSQNTFNGIGTKLYGKSDIDGINDLYTKKMYFTILFIPVFVLGNYLIQLHDGNEYILGKGKLPGIAKGWNSLLGFLLISIISFGFYQKHVNSPEYIAKNLYQEALQAIQRKDFSQAIENLKLVYKGGTSLTGKARDQLDGLVEPENIKRNSPLEVLTIVKGVTSLALLFPQRLDTYRLYFDQFESSAPKVASEFAELIVSTSQVESEIQSYNEKNYRLLVDIYQQDPDDFSVASKYALLEERLNRCLECINILARHKGKLGQTQAARILGQAYAQNRQVEEAYKLLFPYVQARIKIYHQAEEKYDSVVNAVWDDTIEYLNAGKASSSFYTSYDMVTKEEQGRMVDELYIERRDQSVAVTRAKSAYIESTSIVPVALDLGIVLLNRALTLNDPEQRDSSLKQAEDTFLSVQNYAGDSDEYQLYLGQVYYWLGKEEKGDELFSALLDKYQRSHQVLSSLANTLRELGAVAKAKEYALEAYNSGADIKDKQSYAQTLALLSDKIEDKIEWLEQADQSNPYVKGDLLTAKGRKATSENKNDLALNYFQQSIQVYEKIPENATQLNNIALIYLSKYRLGFHQNDFVKALNMLDRAVELVPEDSIVLNNAAFQHLTKAYTDLLSKQINFEALEEPPSLQHFSFLYNIQEEKKAFASKLAKHSSFKKAMSYMKKAMLLAPKNVEILSELLSIYTFLDDRKELAQLATRFKQIELDLSQQQQSINEYRNGEDRKKDLTKFEDYLIKLEKSSRNSVNNNNKNNRSIVRSKLISTRLRAVAYGKPADIKKNLKQARENYELNISSSLAGELQSVIARNLIESASNDLPGFGKFYQQYKYVFGDFSFLAVALATDKQFLSYVEANELGAELQSLLVLEASNFPENPSLISWKILYTLGNPYAQEIKDDYLASDIQNDKDSLAYKMTANQEYIAMYKILKLELQGDKLAARNLNNDVMTNGLVFPDFGY